MSAHKDNLHPHGKTGGDFSRRSRPAPPVDYRTIFEQSGAPAIIVENDLAISRANPKFEQLTGFSRDEIEGKTKLTSFIYEKDVDRIRQYHRARLRKGEKAPGEYECRITDRQGRIRHIFIKVGMIPGARRSITTLIDITRLKEAENALREREALYSAVLEGYEGFIYFISSDYRIRFMNENLIRNTGRDATGEICYQALHGRKKICPWCVSEVVFKGQTVRFEMRNPRDKRWYYSINTPIHHVDGTISYQAMIMDITDRVDMEEALLASEANLREENIRLRSTIQDRPKFGKLVGKSPVMQEVYELILDAAATRANVIVYGESGTGKELVSRAIHDLSDRKENLFVPVNCGAIPENLMESEFFGHRKGAFTGATDHKAGFLDQADGGTLFLDEIGEINLNIQVKLLRAIEGGGYSPVGGNTLRRPDLRIIAATNRNLADQVKAGRMREDFYYRIHIIPIRLPALRDRKEDLPLLVDHFISGYEPARRPPVTGRVLETLQNYDWPGNVRELQNVIHRFVTLKRIDLGGAHRPVETATPPEKQANPPVADLRSAVANFERDQILQALEQNRWNRTRAARTLSVGLRTLQRKMKAYDIA